MIDYYKITREMLNLYDLLEDQQSKEVFFARLRYDLEPSLASLSELFYAGARMDAAQVREQLNFKEHLEMLYKQNKKVIVYGTGDSALRLGRMMLMEKIPFAGFCSRNVERHKEGFLGKTVFSHEYLSENAQEVFLLLPTADHYYSALERLQTYNFPVERILPYFCGRFLTDKRPYFEFPQFFKQGTAFVDGGSYDGATSEEFAKWCSGNYSKIFAFEPEESNLELCRKRQKERPIRNFDLIPAGVGKTNEVLAFMQGKGQGSHLHSAADGDNSPSNVTYVKIVNLDSIVGDEPVGFIKLDIEGAEYDALCGARSTIVRDKPFLAICVYHKIGDQLALMDYLHSIVPEYRFWLRHYAVGEFDTVLYAAVIE